MRRLELYQKFYEIDDEKDTITAREEYYTTIKEIAELMLITELKDKIGDRPCIYKIYEKQVRKSGYVIYHFTLDYKMINNRSVNV